MNKPGAAGVAVVTGGGGGIGAAIAIELGRRGWHVVTVDPLVSADGREALPPPEQTTAGRILAAGGSAQASAASVTDGPAVRALLEQVAAERGGIDAVVNVAGITRPTGYGRGSEDDWRAVVDVHLSGYINVVGAALPLMAAAGRGRILGVTSGSGWRAADAGAYSVAKRAVASLTWELAQVAPAGVRVNALSPIALTRMVTGALARSGGPPPAAAAGAPGAPATGGLSLASLPAPEDLGPTVAYLLGDAMEWCNGQVIFAAGSEVALVEPPRMSEVLATGGVPSLGGLLDAALPRAFAPAHAAQASQGGGNARLAALYAQPPPGPAPNAGDHTSVVVTDRPVYAAALRTALGSRGITAVELPPVGGFEAAAAALASLGVAVDSVIVALGGAPAGEGPAAGRSSWELVLEAHRPVVEGVIADCTWSHAAAAQAAASGRPLRLVHLCGASTAGGRSRAQSAAQAARVAAKSTDGRVTAFAVSAGGDPSELSVEAAELAAYLVASPGAVDLAGAELATGPGWIGLRRHPRPAGSVSFPGPAVPDWLGAVLREMTLG